MRPGSRVLQGCLLKLYMAFYVVAFSIMLFIQFRLLFLIFCANCNCDIDRKCNYILLLPQQLLLIVFSSFKLQEFVFFTFILFAHRLAVSQGLFGQVIKKLFVAQRLALFILAYQIRISK